MHPEMRTGNRKGEDTIVSSLKICAKHKDLLKGSRIHAVIRETGLLENSSYVGSSLVSMYAKCGALEEAREVLRELPVRHLVTWNALIAGYVQQGRPKEALHCIDQMQHDGFSPDAVTFACALRACGSLKAANKGEQIHEQIMKRGLLKDDVVLGTALVDMYAKCGALEKARNVLYELPARDVIAWNALITGYVQHGKAEEALTCTDRMRREGLSPDSVTLACALRACGNIGVADKGEQIHDEIARKGLLENNIVLGTALVDMYAKCGVFVKAQEVLHGLPGGAVVFWNALMAGYIHQGKGEEALSCIHPMQCKGIAPDAVTFACALRACACIGAADKGEQIHNAIVKLGLLKKNVILGTNLVDMYSKCGALEKARKALHELSDCDVITWNALISGYTQQGKSKEVIMSLDQMQYEGYSPNAVTFLCVLNACAHSGWLHKGQMYFERMTRDYGIKPDRVHHCCMVDLFGRAGEIDKAFSVIERMPSWDDLSLWHTLLGACRKWKKVEFGRLAFERAVLIDRSDSAAYLLMSGIYAAAGMHENASMIEDMRLRIESGKSEKQNLKDPWDLDIG